MPTQPHPRLLIVEGESDRSFLKGGTQPLLDENAPLLQALCHWLRQVFQPDSHEAV